MAEKELRIERRTEWVNTYTYLNTYDCVRALREAYRFAQGSPDPSTQNGAVLMDPENGKILVGARNEFPRGVVYSDERWERNQKLLRIEHAERGVIYEAARQGIATEGLTMVCPWAACYDCARAIACAGIKTLVTHEPPTAPPSGNWTESIAVAMGILDEAGVEVVAFVGKMGSVSPIRRSGQVFEP